MPLESGGRCIPATWLQGPAVLEPPRQPKASAGSSGMVMGQSEPHVGRARRLVALAENGEDEPAASEGEAQERLLHSSGEERRERLNGVSPGPNGERDSRRRGPRAETELSPLLER